MVHIKTVAQLFALPLIILTVIVDILVANLSPTLALWGSILFVALNILAGIGSCFVLYEAGKTSLNNHARRKVD